MKGRKSTLIILGISAVLVWALVAFQAIRLTCPKKSEAGSEPRERRQSPTANMQEPPSADFSDPFLKEIYENESEIKDERAKNTHAPDNIPDGPPPIVFKGLIVSSGVPAALVMQDGESVMLRRGGRLKGFLVKDFSYDELILEKEGRKYTLEIE